MINFKGLFGRQKQVVEQKSTIIPLAQGSFLEHAFGGSGYVTAQQAAAFYRSTAAVATAVDMIASAIEQIRPVIKTKDDKFIDDHPIVSMLNKPNGFNDWRLFIGNVARNYLLKHDSLITSSGNNKRPPLELWPMSLQNVSISQSEDDYPSNYIVSRGVLRGNYIRDEVGKDFGTRFYATPFSELYHIRGYSSRYSQVESDSPLQAASQEARQIIKGKTHNLQVLNNGGRLSLLITFKDEDFVDDDEHERRVQRINEQYGGSGNAGKIGVISGADVQNVKEFGKSNKDMDFATLEEAASHAIYLRYGIPLALVTNEASTFNNVQTGIEFLYDNAVLPNADTLFYALTYFLMPRYGLDPNKEIITYNPESIHALKTRTLNEVEQRKKIGVETTNELRSQLPGREPIENGDILYQPIDLVPVGTDTVTDDNNDT